MKSTLLNKQQKLNLNYIIVILLLLCHGPLYSQDQGIKIPDSIGGFFIYKVSKDRIIKKLNDFEKYSLQELDTISKWRYHLALSSCKLYLDMDSSLYHFNEAYNINPKGTCGSMWARHNVFIEQVKEGKENGYMMQVKKETGDSIFSWFLWDLPDFDEFAFIDACNQKYPPKKVEPIVKDSTLNSEIIRRRDQKYRSIAKLNEQLELDQINRDFIDSLYLLEGSLDAFDEDEIYQFSMVAHHSDDCNWVYKWTERLIDHLMNGYKGKMLLGPLLERMLAENEGYCTKQDPQKRDYFIHMIKEKYPDFVEKRNLNW